MLGRILLTSPGETAAAENYWMGYVKSSGTNAASLNSVALDSTGNFYTGGYAWGVSTQNDAYIAKINSLGSFVWQKTFGDNGAVNSARGIGVYGSSSVYLGAYILNNGNDFVLRKLDSSGNTTWTKFYSTNNSSSSDLPYTIAVDSSENVYFSGYGTGSDGNQQALITKWSATSTLLWTLTLLDSAGSDDIRDSKVDASGNLYVCGTNSTYIYVAKISSSGTVLWQRRLKLGTNSCVGTGIALDASGNVYACGYGSIYGFTVKYSNSGVLQWQRRYTGSTTSFASGIAVDPNGDVYTLVYQSSSAYAMILKYNSSGTLLAERYLYTGSTGVLVANKIAVDGNGNIYIAGYTTAPTGSPNTGLFMKLPGDGSKLGTYTFGGLTVQYASGFGGTESAGSLTEEAAAMTTSTATLYSYTGVFSETTSTTTTSVKQL